MSEYVAEQLCPICTGPMWDNRTKKRSGEFSPKSPDFACKDKSCKGVIWPPKNGEIPIVQSVEPSLSREIITKDEYKDSEEKKQLRIARESIFSSLCKLVGENSSMVADKSLRVLSEAIMEEADRVIEWVYKA